MLGPGILHVTKTRRSCMVIATTRRRHLSLRFSQPLFGSLSSNLESGMGNVASGKWNKFFFTYVISPSIHIGAVIDSHITLHSPPLTPSTLSPRQLPRR